MGHLMIQNLSELLHFPGLCFDHRIEIPEPPREGSQRGLNLSYLTPLFIDLHLLPRFHHLQRGKPRREHFLLQCFHFTVLSLELPIKLQLLLGLQPDPGPFDLLVHFIEYEICPLNKQHKPRPESFERFDLRDVSFVRHGKLSLIQIVLDPLRLSKQERRLLL